MATRASSASLKDVTNTITALALSSGIVGTDNVFQALNPDGIPSDLPTDTGKLITVSMTGIRPWEGDAFASDTGTKSENTSSTIVYAEMRVALWLRMEMDMIGRVQKIMDALGTGSAGEYQNRIMGTTWETDPPGQGYLVKLLAVLWDADPTGPAGTLILLRTLEFLGVDFPKETDMDPQAWYPFTTLWRAYFNWDLGLTLAAG